MKRLFALILLLMMVCCASLHANTIDSLAAKSIAMRWWLNGAGREVTSAARSEASATMQKDIKLLATTAQAYIFKHKQDFLLVAKQWETPSILGYGTLHNAQSSLPAALEAMLHGTQSNLSITQRTVSYPLDGANWQPVQPLLTTVRHQSAPYNDYCPYFTNTDGTISDKRCLVGCVATAVEQILTYYRRTYTLADTLKGWTTPNYVIPDVAPGARIDTRLIADNYDLEEQTPEAIDAVARLSYYLGMAFHMNWGLDSSGANSIRLEQPLREVFQLGMVHYMDSYRYHPVAFWNFLAAEIQQHRPVYYAGSIMRTGGHAFVLDGLDQDGLFHVNWGYGGDFDGYFRLDVLAYSQPAEERKDSYVEYGFFCNQEAVVMYPDAIPNYVLPDTLHRNCNDIEVQQIKALQTPIDGCATALQVIVQNKTEQALTTPFAFLLNEPTDTAIFAQAHWLAFSGRTLHPQQIDTLVVHVKFPHAGNQVLRVTPDGENCIAAIPIEIAQGGTEELTATLPEVAFPDSTMAILTQTIYNSTATRGAQLFEYELINQRTGESMRPSDYVYVDAQSHQRKSITFVGLTPGDTYTYNLRRCWPIIQTIEFTQPQTSAMVVSPEGNEALRPTTYFTLSGIRVTRPTAPGIYIVRQGKQITKRIVPLSFSK